ncbi:MAG: hypothetical protein FWD83_08060, partial [Promicromonosporaceae bacterium]|nr:hypothetical protein [Promicromonosporaceae bacterium]
PVRPETPEFQGPWADAMRATFYASDSPFVWAILADGVISQEEVVEAVYRAGECANNSPNMPPGGSIIFNTNVNDRGNMFASFIAPGLSDAPFSSSSAEHSAGERSC